jgi:uncharacterized protein YbjT (DUF2867 family)
VRGAVTGATGNVGTSVLAALAQDSAVTSIVGIARRTPTAAFAKVEWRSADVVATTSFRCSRVLTQSRI